MKITASRESLLAALQKTVGAADRKAMGIPILGNILVAVDEGGGEILATDLSISIKTRWEAVSDQPGSHQTTLPAHKLADFVGTLPKNSGLTIDLSKEGRASLWSGSCRAALATLPAQDFPVDKDRKMSIGVSLPSDTLRTLIKKTAHCAATKDVRYYLEGIYFEFRKDALRAVATDGHRLAYADAAASPEGLADKIIGAIIPNRPIREITRLLNDSSDVIFEINESHARLQIGDTEITTACINMKYPDYERVIPGSPVTIIETDREVLRDMIARSLSIGPKSNGIRLEINRSTISVHAENESTEIIEESMPLSIHNGEKNEVGCNAKYLVDALDALNGPIVRLELGAARCAFTLQNPDDSNALQVIMPMSL